MGKTRACISFPDQSGWEGDSRFKLKSGQARHWCQGRGKDRQEFGFMLFVCLFFIGSQLTQASLEHSSRQDLLTEPCWVSSEGFWVCLGARQRWGPQKVRSHKAAPETRRGADVWCKRVLIGELGGWDPCWNADSLATGVSQGLRSWRTLCITFIRPLTSLKAEV